MYSKFSQLLLILRVKFLFDHALPSLTHSITHSLTHSSHSSTQSVLDVFFFSFWSTTQQLSLASKIFLQMFFLLQQMPFSYIRELFILILACNYKGTLQQNVVKSKRKFLINFCFKKSQITIHLPSFHGQFYNLPRLVYFFFVLSLSLFLSPSSYFFVCEYIVLQSAIYN